MFIRFRVLLMGFATLVLLAGCATGAKRPYYACYFGEALEEKCSQTAVEENRELVCVDVSQETHFELTKCDVQVFKKKYSFF